MLTEPGARLACVSVMRIARIGTDALTDHTGKSLHVKQLVGLKHWARPISKSLNLEDGRLTFHVLEAPDPADALVDFARRNQVDHIVMGARGNSLLRRYLGSVSSTVVAESLCTVTVVRASAPTETEGGEAARSRRRIRRATLRRRRRLVTRPTTVAQRPGATVGFLLGSIVSSA